MRRRFMLLVAVLAVMALWIAPAAHAGGTWSEIDSVPGTQILDVDANHVLFLNSGGGELAVQDRSTQQITLIPAVPGETPVAGFLSPHGAIFAVQGLGQEDREVWEWRDGTNIDLGPMNSDGFVHNFQSLRSAGNFATWSSLTGPPNNPSEVLFRRDLSAGTTVQIAGGTSGSDVAANGDVVYASGRTVFRYRAGVTTALESYAADTVIPFDPRTDGTNVVWRTTDSTHANEGNSAIDGDYAGHITLAASANRQVAPDLDYRVANGWTAFTRGSDNSALTVWVRSPAGTETAVSAIGNESGPPKVLGLNGSGQVVYGLFNAEAPGNTPAFLGEAGEDPIPVGSVAASTLGRGWGDHVFASGGRWYNAAGNSLRRLTLDGETADGSETSIDSGPDPSDSSASATFTFHSTVAGAHFNTQLDGGPWENNTTGTKTYDSLQDGRHVFLVRSVAPNGDFEPEPASQTWTVDTVAPAGVSISDPKQGSATADPTPTFIGAAGVAPGDADHVSVSVYAGTTVGGTPVQTFTAPVSGGTWARFPPADLAEGTYTATATQTDAAGHQTTSGPVTFVVDTTAPNDFALISPADAAQNQSPTPQLRWAESGDAGSGLDHYELWIDDSRSRVLQPSDCSGGSCVATPQSALTEGPHEWQLKAFDRAGNLREPTARWFTVDASPPDEFSLVSPSNGARIGDTTPTLSWQAATDAGAGVDHYDVFVDGSRVATGVTGTEFTLTDALAEGTHVWHVDAVDGAGSSRSSAERSFFLDTTPPQALVDANPVPAYTGDPVDFAAARHDDSDGTITRYEWDLDGDGTFERDTGTDSTTSTTYSTPRDFEMAVRVTDSVGLTNTSKTRIIVRSKPPAGLPGVSIEDGARFTNDRHVVVDVVWTPFAKDLVISNDGGFKSATTFPVHALIPWTLDSSGPERLPKTIYVRFTGFGPSTETYQDDIILDETAPVVMSAEAQPVGTRQRVKVKARDRTSGVNRMQFARKKRHPRHSVRYRRVSTVAAAGDLFVRVRDRAGNWSHWKRVARG